MQIAIIGADERTPALKRCLMESGIGIIEITEQNIRRLMQSQIIVLPLSLIHIYKIQKLGAYKGAK